MGFESRDYIREDARSSWAIDDAPVVKYLVIVNILVFVIQIFWVRPGQPSDFRNIPDRLPAGMTDRFEQINLPNVSVLQAFGELDVQKTVFGGEIWRLITHAFLHSRTSLWHIAMNMMVLYYFGQHVERLRGSREFLVNYLLAAIVAGLFFVALDLITGSRSRAIGASGAVSAVFVMYVMHHPRSIITLFFVIPIEARWALLLFILFDLHPVLLTLSGDRVFTGVAHIAHLGGIAFGYLIEKFDWRLSDWLPSFGRSTTKPKKRWNQGRSKPIPISDSQTFRLNEREESRLDILLDKIATSGMDSLTAAEKDELRVASERIRKNRE